MQRYLSANWIFPVSSAPLNKGVLCISEEGEIEAVLTNEEAISLGIEHIEQFEGVLVPGFINTHCHLELSHLFHKIKERTGLPDFVKEVVAQRNQGEELIIADMTAADKQMYENGIVAVGDISNELISKKVKEQSQVYYHTFVEVFGFNMPAAPIIERAINIKEAFRPLKASIVPHAPYSVAKDLFEAIQEHTAKDDVLSIHNQETEAENEFFEKGTGQFESMYQRLNIPKSASHGNGHNAIRYHLPHLPKNNLLLVHNTFSSKADVDFAQQIHHNLYWCLCPNANLYIEDRLPDVEMLQAEGVDITLGTDSLASNHQLSILSEMQTLQQYRQVPFEELLKWATLNGAKFLGIDAQYGSFEVGKKPGVNLIEITDGQVIRSKNVKRLI